MLCPPGGAADGNTAKDDCVESPRAPPEGAHSTAAGGVVPDQDVRWCSGRPTPPHTTPPHPTPHHPTTPHHTPPHPTPQYT